MRRTRVLLLGIACGLLLSGCRIPWRAEPPPPPTRDRPNILLIVADDLGYSDLGAYGGEIRTPNLDALAASGLQATDFYVAPRGAPTRAMLLTGVDNHSTGFGAPAGRIAPNQAGRRGYEGRLNRRVVTVASLLRDAGYHTVMAGKWALGSHPNSLPSARGFERSFVIHDAAASYWSDMRSAMPRRELATFTLDGEPVEELPEDYYSTRYLADFVIDSIEERRADGSPFFAYLAPQAPHGPLSAPGEWLDRYRGRYDVGYDEIRQERLLRMKVKRLVFQEVRPFPGIPTVPRWTDLSPEQQRQQARKMEIYAAVVENLDFHLGRIFAYLEQIGELHETLIVFLSDSGANPKDRGPLGMNESERDWYAEQFPVTDPELWGREGSFVEYGAAWAQVSMVPFRLFKGTQAEGGLRAPLIVSGPGVARGVRSRALLHVTDLTPTFLEVAGVEHPGRDGGRVMPMVGASLTEVLGGRWRDRRRHREWLASAYTSGRSVRMGRWKIVWMEPPFGVGDWRLYNLHLDPSELFDRSKDRAPRKKQLLKLWERYVIDNQVVLSGEAGAPGEVSASPPQKSSASEIP